MRPIPKLQAAMKSWLEYNFPGTTSFEQFSGVVEEVGELAHAMLKMSQGIRGTKEELEEKERDAIGDVAIYLINYCNTRGYDFEKILHTTWEKVVEKRDWQKNKENGVIDESNTQITQDPPESDGDELITKKIAEAASDYVKADMILEVFEIEDMGTTEYRAAQEEVYEAYQRLVDIVLGVEDER